MESIPRVNVISVETIEACNHEVSVIIFLSFSLLSDKDPAIVFENTVFDKLKFSLAVRL